MSWVAVAIGGTVAVGGAVDANQKKQRNKGYIADAYANSKQQLDLRHRRGRQGAAEALGARGLTAGGDVNASPIATAMEGGKMVATGAEPHTLGAQQTQDNAVQMGLESQDLENQRTRSEQDNKAQYASSLIGSALSGLSAGTGAYNAGEELNAMKPPATPAPAAAAAPASGAGTIRGAYGIDPVSPHPSQLGVGQQNFSFGRGT